jgi:hypothetical protein
VEDQSTDREGSGMNKTAKAIVLGTFGCLIGGIGMCLLMGATRDTWLWMTGFCFVLAPLSIWSGLILKKYLSPNS